MQKDRIKLLGIVSTPNLACIDDLLIAKTRFLRCKTNCMRPHKMTACSGVWVYDYLGVLEYCYTGIRLNSCTWVPLYGRTSIQDIGVGVYDYMGVLVYGCTRVVCVVCSV